MKLIYSIFKCLKSGVPLNLTLVIVFPNFAGVFTELIRDIGVKGVQVEELMTLEDEELDVLK